MRAYLRLQADGWGQRHVDRGDGSGHEIPVLTQDGDFDALNGVAGLTVIPV